MEYPSSNATLFFLVPVFLPKRDFFLLAPRPPPTSSTSMPSSFSAATRSGAAGSIDVPELIFARTSVRLKCLEDFWDLDLGMNVALSSCDSKRDPTSLSITGDPWSSPSSPTRSSSSSSSSELSPGPRQMPRLVGVAVSSSPSPPDSNRLAWMDNCTISRK